MWILLQLETEYKPDAFIHTDTAAKKDNIRRRYIIALIVVLIICIIIICVLSSILILQNLEQEKKEKGITILNVIARKTLYIFIYLTKF